MWQRRSRGTRAAHLQNPPEGLQVAPLALNDRAQDVASDNLGKTANQSGNLALRGHDGGCGVLYGST